MKKMLIVVLGAFILAGCVERRINISTNPEGAIVWLNDKEVGKTPLRLPFTWYGDYDVVVRKEGYSTLKTHIKLKRPWYQIPPIDLFAETLWPGMVYDEHKFEFELTPMETPNTKEIIDRALKMRERAKENE